MNPTPEFYRNSKSFLDRVQIVFNGLTGTTILLYASGFFYYSNQAFPGQPILTHDATLRSLSVIVLILCPLMGAWVIRNYRRDLKTYKPQELVGKLRSYYLRSRHLWVNLFVLALIPVVLYMVSGWHLFSGIYGVMLVLMTAERPAAYRLTRILGMEGEEKRKFLEKEDLF